MQFCSPKRHCAPSPRFFQVRLWLSQSFRFSSGIHFHPHLVWAPVVRHLFILFHVWLMAWQWEMQLVRPQSAHVGFRHHSTGFQAEWLAVSCRVDLLARAASSLGESTLVLLELVRRNRGLKHFQLPIACSTLVVVIPLWCTQMGLNPWKIKWNQGHPGYWPPKCKNEIRGVQPHMLRKEKIISIISHPTEGFAKIKSRGSRNKIKKVPSQHPKCSRNKTEGFKVSICVCEIIWNLNKIYQILNPNISKPSF